MQFKRVSASELGRSGLVAGFAAAVVVAGGALYAASVFLGPEEGTNASPETGTRGENGEGTTTEPVAWPGAGAYAEWTHEQSSWGEGNRDEARATFVAQHDGRAWDATCEGTYAQTPFEGATTSTPLATSVASPGALVAPTRVAAGDALFVPTWEARFGCARVADGVWITVQGVEERAFRINGASVLVEAWKGVVPANEDGFPGGGTAWWDAATGLVLEIETQGFSGTSSTKLSRTNAPALDGST